MTPKFTKGAINAMYVGIDPTGRRGFMRCPVTALSAEELRAWLAIDPATAAKYVHPESLRGVPVVYQDIDNEAGKPIPTLSNGGKRK